jgi:hypothetical protein
MRREIISYARRVAVTCRGYIRTINANPSTLDYENLFKRSYVNIYIVIIIKDIHV